MQLSSLFISFNLLGALVVPLWHLRHLNLDIDWFIHS